MVWIVLFFFFTPACNLKKKKEVLKYQMSLYKVNELHSVQVLLLLLSANGIFS